MYETYSLSDGAFSQDNLVGTVTIRVEKDGWVFTPEKATVNGVTDSLIFTGKPSTYTASGLILDANGDPIEGVLVSFEDEGDVVATARTDHDGCFEKSGLTGGYYVTAQKDGWSFAPDSILVTSATDSINFYGAYVQESYGASGRITYDDGNPVPAVVVTFTFLDSDRPDVYTTTDKNGTWSFEGLVGRVRVIPTKPGHVFTPGSQEIEGETINLNFWARTE